MFLRHKWSLRTVLIIAALAFVMRPMPAQAEVIGLFQWVDCGTDPSSPDFDMECSFFPDIPTIFRIDNYTADFANNSAFPDFPSLASLFSNIVITSSLGFSFIADVMDSVPPGASGHSFYPSDQASGEVSLALTLDSGWVGTLTLPTLTAANTFGVIDFTPQPSTPPTGVPEPSSLLLLGLGVAGMRLLRRPA